jgi:hypothetical protein
VPRAANTEKSKDKWRLSRKDKVKNTNELILIFFSSV